MKRIVQFYQLFNLLSLDVAIGAMCMAYFASQQLQSQIPFIYLILLGMAVWAIYLTDHLYDARKKEIASYRRSFVKKYSNELLGLAVINFLTLVILFYLNFRLSIVKWSIGPLLITIIYLLANWRYQKLHKPFYAKEILIAVGYVLGILVLPLAFSASIDIRFWLISFSVLCMAIWNVLLISIFEKKHNEEEGQTTISQWMTIKQIKRTIVGVALIFATLVIFNISMYPLPLFEIIIWGTLFIYMIVPLLFPAWIALKERYNKWVEQIFLIPGIYFLIECVSNGIFSSSF